MFCFCAPQGMHSIPSETHPQKVIKMVLLGTSMSGKTTIAKQFKQICDSPYLSDKDPILAPLIRDRIVMNMQTLCKHSLFGISYIPYIAAIRDEILSLQSSLTSHELTKDIAFKMAQLWKDDGIKATYQQRHCRFHMDDNFEYFMNKIHDIARPEYVADFEDYVRLDVRSTGYSTTKLMKCVDNYGAYCVEVLDIGGTRSERKKWWKNNLLFNGVDLDAFLYTVPISDYDLTLFENEKCNRVIESIRLWKETMIKSDFFNDKPVFILFNKYDRFLEKIKKIPITRCFDDFPDEMDPNDPHKVIQFIAGKFIEVFNEHDIAFKGPLRIFRTTATDTASIENAFNQIMPQIIRQKVSNGPEL